jgi:hypothetical protein
MIAVPTTSPVPPWRTPPETWVLDCGEVHVWQATLDQHAFLHTLAPDDQARASRFYFERDQQHFIVARGALWAILGGYLSRAPESRSFCYGAHGKPACGGPSDGDAIQFNVSNSHEIALYAVDGRWRCCWNSQAAVPPEPRPARVAVRNRDVSLSLLDTQSDDVNPLTWPTEQGCTLDQTILQLRALLVMADLPRRRLPNIDIGQLGTV